MNRKEKILIIDDSEVSRTLLQKMLADTYSVYSAKDGKEAIQILLEHKGTICAVLLDLMMPVMDGFAFLNRIKRISGISTIPIVVITQEKDEQTEIKALQCGAADFITKPFHEGIVRQRLANLISLSETAALRNAVERDYLTGAYNRETFLRKAREMMRSSPQKSYDMVCVDVEHFKLINDLFGTEAGNRLLKYLAEEIQASTDPLKCVCGRMMGDNFALCILRGEGHTEMVIEQIREKAKMYPLEIHVHLHFGIYQIHDITVPVATMCDRANLAIETVKGNGMKDFAYYDPAYYKDLLKAYAVGG